MAFQASHIMIAFKKLHKIIRCTRSYATTLSATARMKAPRCLPVSTMDRSAVSRLLLVNQLGRAHNHPGRELADVHTAADKDLQQRKRLCESVQMQHLRGREIHTPIIVRRDLLPCRSSSPRAQSSRCPSGRYAPSLGSSGAQDRPERRRRIQ